MSFSLFVFHVSSPRTRDQLLAQAQSHYQAMGETGEDESAESEPVVEASPKINAFLQDLNARYPTAEDVLDLPDQDRWKSPWAGSMDVTAGTVEIPMDNSTPDEAYDLVVALAKEHGLVCVGPEDNDLVYAPPELLIGPPPKSKLWWQFWK